jgi:ABC transport system ATP-binding/permease protein
VGIRAIFVLLWWFTKRLFYAKSTYSVSYFRAVQISKSFGEKVLFKDLTFSLSQGDKIGLIAPNGTGKTTLLQIMAGKDHPDAGQCVFQPGIRMALLEQNPVFDPSLSVAETLLHADNELTRTIKAYEVFILGNTTKQPSHEKQLQAVIERMDALQAWDYEQRIREVTGRLNIGKLDALAGTLSGGQQKRLALARILLDDADVLLLDEPTNHLDIEMIEWLESFLNQKNKTLMVVTHDRYFLDAVSQGIIELDRGQLYNYRGNYSYFLEKKQERLSAAESERENALNMLRKETEWMRRSPPARTTKSKARISAYYELQEKAAMNRQESSGMLQLPMTRLGKKILELEEVSKGFDGQDLISGFSHVFKKGERTGIAGPNGCGKSTLLNIITARLSPDSGRVTTGETIVYGYYRQEGLQVDEDKKVVEVISDIADVISLGNGKTYTAQQLLTYFNFPYPVQNDRVQKLSGGEKRRLYLITVLMRNPNFLILDEPTNDLDIDTLNLLEEFLQDFPGCLLIVSHDRYFLDRLTEHLFVFEGQGRIKHFPGNYTEYRLQKASEEKEKKSEISYPPLQERKRNKSVQKLSYKEQKEYEVLETDIEQMEREKLVLMEKMNQGELTPDEWTKASASYADLETRIEEKTGRWLQLAERL